MGIFSERIAPGGDGYVDNRGQVRFMLRRDFDARNKLYQSILAASDVDDITKQEFSTIMKNQPTFGAGAMAQKLQEAREGKGIYASRQIFQAERKLQKDMPGRRQLSPGSLV